MQDRRLRFEYRGRVDDAQHLRRHAVLRDALGRARRVVKDRCWTRLAGRYRRVLNLRGEPPSSDHDVTIIEFTRGDRRVLNLRRTCTGENGAPKTSQQRSARPLLRAEARLRACLALFAGGLFVSSAKPSRVVDPLAGRGIGRVRIMANRSVLCLDLQQCTSCRGSARPTW
jgi:hypothetical protein